MAITMDGIFVNGQKVTFAPEDILTGDASAYTEEIGTAVEEWMEENVTGGEQVTDTTLTLPGVPADAKKTGDKIGELKEDLNAAGLSNDAKVALLNCFAHVAWIDEHGQDYYDALEDALYLDTGLVRIDAVFIQGSAVIYPNTPLNDLKAYLVVTGYYDNGTSKTITDYSLSGTLAVGTSTVTVTREEKTDTFTVTVSSPYWDYEWSADSGELPSGMTADSYDFTTESGAMFVQQPNLDFGHVGNARIQVEARFYGIREDQTILYSANNPQIVITNAKPTSGNYRGIKVIAASSLNTEDPKVHNMLGVGINGTNALVSGYYTDEYHVYDITAENNVYAFTVDGESISLTQNANTTPYLGMTGIQSAVDSGGSKYFAYIKSIKFKELGA